MAIFSLISVAVVSVASNFLLNIFKREEKLQNGYYEEVKSRYFKLSRENACNTCNNLFFFFYFFPIFSLFLMLQAILEMPATSLQQSFCAFCSPVKFFSEMNVVLNIFTDEKTCVFYLDIV